MFLNIILTLLTIVLITITVLIYIWWKKYGKQLFDTMNQMKTLTQNPMNLGNTLKENGMTDLIKSVNQIFNSFKK